MDKVLREAARPRPTAPAIQIHAAGNEYEPFQLVVRADADASITVTRQRLHRPRRPRRRSRSTASTTSRSARPSDPGAIASGRSRTRWSRSRSAAPSRRRRPEPAAVVHRPSPPTRSPATTTPRSPSPSPASPTSRSQLHVFDFTLPAELGFDGNWNGSFEALGGGESLEGPAAQGLLLRPPPRPVLRRLARRHQLQRRHHLRLRPRRLQGGGQPLRHLRSSAPSTSTASAGTASASRRSRP
jgi:hypothetical protein